MSQVSARHWRRCFPRVTKVTIIIEYMVRLCQSFNECATSDNTQPEYVVPFTSTAEPFTFFLSVCSTNVTGRGLLFNHQPRHAWSADAHSGYPIARN
jgi:hypothetical protein